jgi:hypothetical protein
MIAYFGEVIQMCANISYLMMTLNRFLLVGKDHAHWLVSIAKLEFKWVIRGSMLFSALINIGHGWEFRAAWDINVNSNLDNYALEYSNINGGSYSGYPVANQTQPYFIYLVVYFVFNFGLFFTLNTAIEVNLVRRMRKELQEKRDRLAKMNADKSSVSVVATTGSADFSKKSSQLAQDKKKEEEDVKKERKVMKMVILNGFFNFILSTRDSILDGEFKCLVDIRYRWTIFFCSRLSWIFKLHC